MTVTLDPSWLAVIIAVCGQAAIAVWMFATINAKQTAHERRLTGLEITFKEERAVRTAQQEAISAHIATLEIGLAKVETCLQSIDRHIQEVVMRSDAPTPRRRAKASA